MIRLEQWSDFKTILDQFSIYPQYVSYSEHYYLTISKNELKFDLILLKSTPANSDQLDFETNYLSHSNPTAVQNVTVIGNVTPNETTLDPTQSQVDISFTKIDLPRSTEAYATIYNYNGSGKFHSFSMDFNSDNVMVKLTIDGNQIFEIDCKYIEDMSPSVGETGGIRAFFGWLGWESSKNVINFYPRYSIKFLSNIKIEAKANSNTTTRDMDGYLIDIVKES